MIVGIGQIALLVHDYDEAMAFYCGKLGFRVVEDSPAHGTKRWVRLEAPGKHGSQLLLSRAIDDRQRTLVGNQAGGRVFLFLHTDDLDSDCAHLRAQGVRVTEEPRLEPYGHVAVIQDLYGNRIDLIQPREESPR